MLVHRLRRWPNIGPTLGRNLVFAGMYSVSVYVYYVAVRTIVLLRDGSNLARPVIIHIYTS